MARHQHGAPTKPAPDAALRGVRITIQLTESEAATVRAAAENAHLPVASYMRSVVLRDAEGSR